MNLDTIKQHDETYYCQLLQQMGDGCYAIGEYEQARGYYDKAALVDPDAAQPYVGIGMLDYQEGELDDAELAFRVACRLDPGSSRAYLGIAMVAQKKNDHKYAFEMYLKSIDNDSDNLLALLGLFQTSCQMGTFENITKYLEHYLELHTDDSSVMSCLASLYIRDNKLDRAKSMLDKILTIAPNDETAVDLLEEVEYSIAKLKADRR